MQADGNGRHGGHSLAWPQPTGLHTSSLVSKQAGNAVGQRETILDLPFTHSLPSRALPDGPIHQPQAFRSWLDVLQLHSWERHSAAEVDQAAARRRRSTGKRGALFKAETGQEAFRASARQATSAPQ